MAEEKKQYDEWPIILFLMFASWYFVESFFISVERGLIHELIQAIF